MLSKEKLDQLNMLARKAKTETLSNEEKALQDELRQEYLQKFRKHFKSQLDNIKFVDEEDSH